MLEITGSRTEMPLNDDHDWRKTCHDLSLGRKCRRLLSLGELLPDICIDLLVIFQISTATLRR